jgi:hypothetical protein
MLYHADRFANGNQKIAMLLQRKIQSRFTRRKTRRTFRDNKNLDYISSLEQRSGAHRYVKIMTKRTPITPMLNLMFIKLTPLRNKC